MRTLKYLATFVAGAILALGFAYLGFDAIDREEKVQEALVEYRCAHAGESPSEAMKAYCRSINP